MDHKPEGKSRDFIKTGEETCHVFKASRLVAFTLNQRSTPMKNLKNDRGKWERLNWFLSEDLRYFSLDCDFKIWLQARKNYPGFQRNEPKSTQRSEMGHSQGDHFRAPARQFPAQKVWGNHKIQSPSRKVSERKLKCSWKSVKRNKGEEKETADFSNTKIIGVRVSCWFTIQLTVSSILHGVLTNFCFLDRLSNVVTGSREAVGWFSKRSSHSWSGRILTIMSWSCTSAHFLREQLLRLPSRSKL